MVLVSYRLNNNISLLQTKFRYRERHEARRIGLEAMPLDEHIESGHRECQARLKIGPAPMHHPLKGVADRLSGATPPPHHHPPHVEQQKNFPADNPAMIGESYPADLL